jgi:hypothetical protein
MANNGMSSRNVGHMDSREKMEVADWQDSPAPVFTKHSPARRFLSPTLIGILGTLLLHTLVIQSLPFGRGSKAKPLESVEQARPFSKSTADLSEGFVLISLPSIADSPNVFTPSIALSLPDLRKMNSLDADLPAWPNIETLALSEDPAPQPTTVDGEGAEQARLFGIYTGQIQARIDRVWRRPRTPVNEDLAPTNKDSGNDSFQCEAQIVQDLRGNVQEILLPRCNGSSAWQRSLVLAIRQASPLSAPPNPSVFNHSVTLSFIGLPYVPGSLEDDYEIEPRQLARK